MPIIAFLASIAPPVAAAPIAPPVAAAPIPHPGAAAPIPHPGAAAPVGYAIAVTTAYALTDPFPNRIDRAFTGEDTGYLQIANTGGSTFRGSVGTIAVSAFAGDLSFAVDGVTLAPGESISIAIPDDASNVGGFNGPAYQARPGVEIFLRGAMSLGAAHLAVDLLVADADIHSGVPRTDPAGLITDSFVLQGGDPWGFDTGDEFELTQARGTFVFQQAVTEPAGIALLAVPFGLLARRRGRVLRRPV